MTIEADIIKQKLPTTNGGLSKTALNFGKTAEAGVYTKLTSDHPIDLCRYQVLNCYAGRVGLGKSTRVANQSGAGNLAEAVRTAVVNKRAGGTGLISGRKAFQKPMRDGVGDSSRRSRTSTSRPGSRSPEEARGYNRGDPRA